jgi:hypothetical protein
VSVGGRRAEADRDARTLAEDRALCPRFARSVGLGPVSSPRSGALPILPSADSDAPVEARKGVVGEQATAPEVLEHAALAHS